MRVLAVLFFSIMLPMAACAEDMGEEVTPLQPVVELKTIPPITSKCEVLHTDSAREMCSNVDQAKTLLSGVKLRFVADKRGIAHKREVALAILSPETGSPVIIHLFTPLHPPTGKTFIPEVVGPVRHKVEHVRGQYVYKLTFRVTTSESAEETVLAAKHLFIPPGERGDSSLKRLEATAEELVYYPMSETLYRDEFFEQGLEIVHRDGEHAFNILHEHEVASKAFPGSLLADKYNADQVAHNFAIEMTDPFRLYGLPYMGKPQQPEPDLMRYMFAEVFLWGEKTFSYLCSSAQACGRHQFTNNPTKKGKKFYPGTYSNVVNSCVAKDGTKFLNPDFYKGTADHVNSAMAEICLLDMELAALPRAARDLYEKDQEAGMMLPHVSYNAGGWWGTHVSDGVMKLFATRGGLSALSATTINELPSSLFMGVKKGKPFLNSEPCYYMHKWIRSWIDFRIPVGEVPSCGKGG